MAIKPTTGGHLFCLKGPLAHCTVGQVTASLTTTADRPGIRRCRSSRRRGSRRASPCAGRSDGFDEKRKRPEIVSPTCIFPVELPAIEPVAETALNWRNE